MQSVCRLCGRVAKLENSHIISRWIYKRALRRESETSSKLIRIDMERNGVYSDSKQMRDRLLCRGCEQRLSKFESYAEVVTVQPDGRFPAIEDRRPTALSLWYEGASTQCYGPGLNRELLSQFALSLFWRAHASSKVPNFDLGPLADPVRRACVGEEVELPRLLLRALVRPDVPIDGLFTIPTRENTSVSLVVFGLHFDLALEHDQVGTMSCFRRTGTFLLSDGEDLLQHLASMARAPRKGALARVTRFGTF